jgi:hypothetical protein
MSSNVLPFRRTAAALFASIVTSAERNEAVAWCMRQGPKWKAEIHRCGAQKVGLVIAPGAGPGWIIERTPTGLVLADPATFAPVGVFKSMGEVLEALTMALDA